MNAKRTSYLVVFVAWLAVFSMFGYRSTFAVLQGSMAQTMGWTTAQVSGGYSLMMTIYATMSFFSGYMVDKWGSRPLYFIAAIFCMLGFFLTARVTTLTAYYACYSICAGIGTGMLWVPSTVGVRKWFVGTTYGTMWGFAFAGAPMAQVLLSLSVKPMLVANPANWRNAMTYLSWLILIMLLIAALCARKNPEHYGLHAFGEVDTPKDQKTAPAKPEFVWTLKQAYQTRPIWTTIICFMCCSSGEFLIWTQIVRYWTHDLQIDLSTATYLYVLIGIAGIFTMPLLGKLSDHLVHVWHDESKARKFMLVVGPSTGIIACALLLLMSGPNSISIGVISGLIFAIYWAIVPGGCVGYVGSIYGRKSLGKIWGLGTWIANGIGPAVGSYMGGYLADTYGTFSASIYFALGSFVIAALAASTMPRRLKAPDEV